MRKNRWPIASTSLLYSARPGAPRYSIFDAVDFFANAGFNAMDVNFSATILPGERMHEPMLDGDGWRNRMEALRIHADKRSIRLICSHAPYHHKYNSDSPDYPMCDEMVHRAIEATALLGGTHIVVHPLMTSDRDVTLVEASISALEPLARYAEQFGVRLAVENMRCTSPEVLAEIADSMGADVCWDVGHAHVYGLDQESSLSALGNRVKVVHIHDNYGLRTSSLSSKGPSCSDLHLPPFLGTVDWASFLRGLDRIGFTGAFNYEVKGSKLPEGVRESYAQYLIQAAEDLMHRPELDNKQKRGTI